MATGEQSGTLAEFGWTVDEFVGGEVGVKAWLVRRAVAFGVRNRHWALVFCPFLC